MNFEIRPFCSRDIEAAGRLLADRQRRLRQTQPLLPDRYESVAATRTAVEELSQKSSGVAAFADGRMTGYLLGTPNTNWGVRMTLVPLAGQSVADPGEVELYRSMYAAASPAWLREGFFTHAVDLPAADPVATEAWFSLGFGREIEMGLRETDVPAPSEDGKRVEQVGPEEVGHVQEFIQALGRFNSLPPLYRPYVRSLDQGARFRASLLEQMQEPAYSFWLAYEDEEPAGLIIFTPPEPDELIVSPNLCTYIWIAYVAPHARAGGIGSAMLDHGLALARDVGNAYCTVGWFSANLDGARFWQRKGFAPLAHRLHRHLDERISWATSEG